MKARVIGLPSPMNGEVPYPIVERLPEGVSEGEMREFFVNTVGANFGLGAVLTLGQLGMEGWPLTTTGKVLKWELECAALKYLQQNTLFGYAIHSL